MRSYYLNINMALLVFALSSCGTGEKKAVVADTTKMEITQGNIPISQAQFEQGAMALGSLVERPFPITVKANGMIDVPPENRAVVSAAMGGYIKITHLLVGDFVKKGQLLVTVENTDFVTLQRDYLEIDQQLSYLGAEFERQKTLVAENITSQKNFLKAESDYNSAVARHNGLKKQLQLLNLSPSEVEKGNISSTAQIYAPISGHITAINVNKGTYVSPAMPILEIIDNDHIHVELSVFEKDVMKLKKGQPIRFSIPEASTENYDAEVHLIGTAIESNRTIKVHGHLLDEERRHFLVGMFVNAEIETSSQLGWALPENAIVTIGDRNYVLRLKEENNGTFGFEQLEVATGPTANGFTEIQEDAQIAPKDRFLVKGAFDLLAE